MTAADMMMNCMRRKLARRTSSPSEAIMLPKAASSPFVKFRTSLRMPDAIRLYTENTDTSAMGTNAVRMMMGVLVMIKAATWWKKASQRCRMARLSGMTSWTNRKCLRT